MTSFRKLELLEVYIFCFLWEAASTSLYKMIQPTVPLKLKVSGFLNGFLMFFFLRNKCSLFSYLPTPISHRNENQSLSGPEIVCEKRKQKLLLESVSGRNKCMCCSSYTLCYGRVWLCVTHNFFASYDEDVILTCRANKADCQRTKTLSNMIT